MVAREKKMNIIQELKSLIEQATKERSHYYVKSVAEKALLTINNLEKENEALRKYCGVLIKTNCDLSNGVNAVNEFFKSINEALEKERTK